jgi:hypothetical protein
MEAKTVEYRVRYSDGAVLVMPFSRPLEIGHTWKDGVATWRVVRMGAAVPGEPVDVWVEPVRD